MGRKRAKSVVSAIRITAHASELSTRHAVSRHVPAFLHACGPPDMLVGLLSWVPAQGDGARRRVRTTICKKILQLLSEIDRHVARSQAPSMKASSDKVLEGKTAPPRHMLIQVRRRDRPSSPFSSDSGCSSIVAAVHDNRPSSPSLIAAVDWDAYRAAREAGPERGPRRQPAPSNPCYESGPQCARQVSLCIR